MAERLEGIPLSMKVLRPNFDILDHYEFRTDTPFVSSLSIRNEVDCLCPAMFA